MTRFLSIATALGEAAALQGRQPTVEQFEDIEKFLREQIVIDFDSGIVGIRYSDGSVVEPAVFVENELQQPWIEARSTRSTNSRCTPSF